MGPPLPSNALTGLSRNSGCLALVAPTMLVFLLCLGRQQTERTSEHGLECVVHLGMGQLAAIFGVDCFFHSSTAGTGGSEGAGSITVAGYLDVNQGVVVSEDKPFLIASPLQLATQCYPHFLADILGDSHLKWFNWCILACARNCRSIQLSTPPNKLVLGEYHGDRK